MRRALVLLALLLPALACGTRSNASGNDAAAAARADLRIVFVTHGQSADPFWSVVANGAREAAREFGVRVQYQAPRTFDMVEMSNLIHSALAAGPAGIVVSIPDPGALGPAIRAAVAAGHALCLDATRWLAHIPPDEYRAWALSLVLYLEGGVRVAEIGSVMFGRQPDGSERPATRELVRLAFPRRVYTQSHVDYVAEVVLLVASMAHRIRGVRIVKAPPVLRHFTAEMEPAHGQLVAPPGPPASSQARAYGILTGL